jgi:2-dehydro-3-deoxyglucarate aldolase/4-hydroxy-2-oxoheptanedioate aldolase
LPTTPIVTSVHPLQIVDEKIPMTDHDIPLTAIAAPHEVIETRTALERIDELLAVPHIDAVLIGPGDLSISLGIPGEFDHPQFVAAVEAIRDRCARAGVAPGMHMRSLELGKRWTGRGLQLVSCNSDLGFLLDKATETVAALKGGE